MEIPERCTGSEGNRKATSFLKEELSFLGFETESFKFDAMDWNDGGASLTAGDTDFEVFLSPYSRGCTVNAQLASAASTTELEKGTFRDKILLLHGEITKEQLMPKNFIFYNPEEHKKIISLLERSYAKAIVCATGRNPELAGGIYPFPLIEDGDFDIPSVYMTKEEGKRLLSYTGKQATLLSTSKRIPGTGYNVTGKKGKDNLKRIVITAHIDAKKGSPGATDNATGIAVLLILADMLKNYSGDKQIELTALNGEDHYAVPGQMNYIQSNKYQFDNILLNINIDGAAYKEGKSCFSFFDLPDDIYKKALGIMEKHPDITEGIQWPQGDHSIFIQYGRPAIAVSSKWFIENDAQDITHTPKDNIDIVDCNKIIDITEAICELINKL